MALDVVYPFADERDFTDADHGLIAELEPGVVRNASGEVAWDNDSYSFLSGVAPDTIRPAIAENVAVIAAVNITRTGQEPS